jgi:rubrerythrin
MKTAIKIFVLISAIGLISGCNQKPVKTIEDLRAAFNGESSASAKYAAYAKKAYSETYDTVAVMFTAISKAEAIHAENHRKVLEKLGEKIEGPTVQPFNVLSTIENLADAIKGETYEVETMYPGFIAAAEKEKCPDAVKSFTWAHDTEKKHKKFYEIAESAISGIGEKNLPAHWLVCPVCGNTYDIQSMTSKCDFCMTPQNKFISY